MKTTLHALLFLLLSATSLSAQDYEPLLNNTKWYYQWFDWGGIGNFAIQKEGEVTIGAYTYTRVTNSATDYLLREDVAARRVYLYHNGGEEVLYDFSLQLNDVIQLGPQLFQVVNLANVNVNGGTRRGMRLNNLTYPDSLPEVWIEGVGITDRPFYIPWYENPSDPAYQLRCTYQNNINVYNFGIANNITPTDCAALSVTEPFKSATAITFAPNPFHTELTINSPIALSNATLQITNALGQTVAEIQNIRGNTTTINRNNLQSGLYIAQLSQDGKTIATEKILITD